MIENVIDPELILTVSLLIIPAYVANAMADVFGGGRPIDGGRTFVDGRRILGSGKTVKGALGGVFSGTLCSFVEGIIVMTFVVETFSLSLYVALGCVIAAGAMSGDIFGAFMKRRLSLPSGAPAPPLDQLGFILTALLFAFIFTNFIPLVKITLGVVVIILVITPFIHILSCYIGYMLGKKRAPW